MAQFAVIHTASRVVRALTVDALHGVAADESLISLVDPMDLAGGPWVLPAGQGKARRATPAEIDAADADGAAVKQRRDRVQLDYVAATEALRDDVTVPAKYREFFRLHALVAKGLTR